MNNLDPSSISSSSHLLLYWRCQKGHEWITSPNNRTGKGGRNCPYCANKKACVDNCLATKNPQLAFCWYLGHKWQHVGKFMPNTLTEEEKEKYPNGYKCKKCRFCGTINEESL